jgi:ATP-dependent Clp protease adaptor protein ClpS
MGFKVGREEGAFMSTHTQTVPERELDTGLDEPWMVILFNDDHHTFDAVVDQVQKATGCDPGEAFQITYSAHTNGQAIAYVAAKPACEQVAAVLREIDLHVEIEAA